VKDLLSVNKSFQILWGGQFLAIASLTIMVPLLSLYMTELGALTIEENRLWTGLSLAAPALTFILFSPLWGRMGDRWGRKWMVIRALFGIGLCLILMGFAETPFQFFLCRLLQGACGGVVDSASAFAGSEAPKEERGKILGFLQSATATGSLIGPLLGGLFIDWLGFPPLFWMMGSLTILVGLLMIFILKENRKPRESNRSHVEKDKKSVPLYRVFIDLLKHPRIHPFLIAGICSQIGIFGFIVVFAPFIEGLGGTSGHVPTWVGILQAIAWGAGMIGAPWWGLRNDRKKIELNFWMAITVCGISIVLQSIPHHVAWLIPLRMVQGFCFSAILQSIMFVVTEESKEENRGVRVGASNSFLVVGQIIGSLLGALLGGYLSNSWIIVIMGSLFFIGSLSMLQLVSWPSNYQINLTSMRWKMKNDK
jgi:MFS family permease